VVLTRTAGRASPMPPGETLAAFAATGATLAIHLSIHVLSETCAALAPFYGETCPAAVVWRASWPEQRVVRGTLAALPGLVAAAPMERTALILVGPALDPGDVRPSALYDGRHARRFRDGRPDAPAGD
jgi:precorrin-4/cobalt-precorrin-4 C11-methyltransferase